MRRFPTLEILDKEPVTKISFDAPQTPQLAGSSTSHSTAKDFPAEMQPPLIAGVDGNIITSFFARYELIYLLVESLLTVYSASSHCLIHNEPRFQTFIMSLPRSHFKPTHPSLSVPKSKDSSSQKRCQINATWNGRRGWVQGLEILVGWQVQSTRC